MIGWLVFVAAWIAVVVLISRYGTRFFRWLIDKELARAARDPYFNRNYARPPRWRCLTCNGSGRSGRWRRCPTCLGKQEHE